MASDSPPPATPATTLFEAIVRTRCVEATYNGGEVVLAPHVAFTRHSDIYVGAVTVARNGQPPREEKIGLFKLDGLANLRLTESEFAPSPLFEPGDERFARETLLAVERRAA